MAYIGGQVMIQTCSKCKNYDISISDEPCRERQKAFRRGEGKPNFIASITNADRIRSMTDEELAEWLCDIAGWLPMYEGKMHPILDWLKEEVTANDS